MIFFFVFGFLGNRRGLLFDDMEVLRRGGVGVFVRGLGDGEGVFVRGLGGVGVFGFGGVGVFGLGGVGVFVEFDRFLKIEL